MDSRQRHTIEAFYRLGLPGMTLVQKPKPKPQRPLVKRCEGGCGRRISDVRTRCMACQSDFLTDIASQIPDQDLFDAVLSRQPAEHRRAFYDGLKPYLSFTPAPFQA